jgi:hypothetical protein
MLNRVDISVGFPKEKKRRTLLLTLTSRFGLTNLCGLEGPVA